MRRARVGNTRITVQVGIGCGDAVSRWKSISPLAAGNGRRRGVLPLEGETNVNSAGLTPLPHLWRTKDVLDRRHTAAVVEVLTAWMQGHVLEDALRHALTVSGEMDRWNSVTPGAKDRERLDDALSTEANLLNTVPPGRPILEPTRANGRLRQVIDCRRTAKK